jgi:predicted metalloprotease with PDZ domain
MRLLAVLIVVGFSSSSVVAQPGSPLPGRSQPQNPLAESKTISANGPSSSPTRVGAERLLAANRTSAAHPMTIVADLRDAPQQLLSAEIDIPVKPGPFTFTAARWTLGNHSPSGPIGDITGITVTADGRTLPWKRDRVDLYAFHVRVPSGVNRLHIHDEYLAWEQGIDVTPNLVELEWGRLMLYPAGVPVGQIIVQPSVLLPEDWQIGSALTFEAVREHAHLFRPTSIRQLEDSPILAGRYFREIPLAESIQPSHYLDVAAESEADLDRNLSTPFLAALNRLVPEAKAMYGPSHYRSYHFLLTLSDYAGRHGLEHEESSNDGCSHNGFSEPKQLQLNAELLPHEFTHSWNGKYRLPVGIDTPDFATPMQDDLLWIYEGMTRYLGDVLAVRSGFETPEEYRAALAFSAARQQVAPGRSWRTTEDSAVAAPIGGASFAYDNWRLSQDYYSEGELLWLDVDTRIRTLTHGRKSLRDFTLLFLAKSGATGPVSVPYDLDEIVADLNRTVPYPWARLFRRQIYTVKQAADLDGLERSGWHLVYKSVPGSYEEAYMTIRAKAAVDTYFSLGLIVGMDGTILDVRFFSPAFSSKLAPHEKIISVDGQAFSPDVFRKALQDAAVGVANGTQSSMPIRLVVRNGETDREVRIDYHDGEKYPALERIPEREDLLSDILSPMT